MKRVYILDKRICDILQGSSNKQTFREFIIEKEREFNISNRYLDNLSNSDIKIYAKYLYNKGR